VILAVLDAMGVAAVGVDGYEADDVIARSPPRDPPVDIVSGDRDLFQLIRPGVRVLYTVEKGRPTTTRPSPPGWRPERTAYADFALLRGDPSDGLPGVAGVRQQDGVRAVTRYDPCRRCLRAGRGEPVPAPFAAGRRDYLDAAGLSCAWPAT